MSGSFRSLPGVAPAGDSVASNGNSLSANYNVSSAILQAQTGRPLVPGLAFQTVNLLPQGHTFPDRLNSLDIRVGKILRFGRTRTNIAIDFYNRVQQQHRNGVQPDLRSRHQRRDVAGADDGAQSAVCAVQCDLRFLSTADNRKGGFLCEGVALKSCCEP